MPTVTRRAAPAAAPNHTPARPPHHAARATDANGAGVQIATSASPTTAVTATRGRRRVAQPTTDAASAATTIDAVDSSRRRITSAPTDGPVPDGGTLMVRKPASLGAGSVIA